MNRLKLDFLLENIHSLAFVNPFAGQRDEIEGTIISQMGQTEKPWIINSKFTNEFNQVLYWVEQGEQSLLSGVAKVY